ncbi:unnamed protein product [Symbiodinium sp. CCMP2456]|nr:unnamed protein product [Symbiodinium sp. CCMP2456]
MEWQPRRLAAHPSQPGMQYSGPSYWTPGQYAQPWHFAPPAQFGTPWGQMQDWHPAAPSAQFEQSSHVAAPSDQLRQERVLDESFCLIDNDGKLRPLSSVSEISGKNYEQMIFNICCSGGPRILWALDHQQEKERARLDKCKNAVADFLSPYVRAEMRATGGVGEMNAEIDAFYNGSFKDFAEHINDLVTVTEEATCANVTQVLVEVCSDSRFVAKKLYQIEFQTCLVQRRGFLVGDDTRKLEPVQLDVDKTGYAIVYNRAAMQIETAKLAASLGLINVLNLLEEQKLHIVFFQPEAVLPAALRKARQAAEKAEMALQRVQGMGTGPPATAATVATRITWVRQLVLDKPRGRASVAIEELPCLPPQRTRHPPVQQRRHVRHGLGVTSARGVA